MKRIKVHYLLILLLALAFVFGTPGLSRADSGVLTPQAPYITLDAGVPAGSSVTAIISSGESVNNVLFEGIPNGLGLAPGPWEGTVDVYVNHEETTVPFFGEADFQDASVTKWTLDVNSAGVLAGSVALSSDNGFLRFCSAFMAGPAEGFSRYTFFTGEETNDIVDVPPGAPYGRDPAVAPQRQGGYAVVLDAATGALTQVGRDGPPQP